MYYIYHIPGVKIGCSTIPKIRVKNQGYEEFEILEQHESIDFADQREMELQIEYGYDVDKVRYSKSIANLERGKTKESCSKGGRIRGPIQGKKNVESGHLDRIRVLRKPNTPEHQFKLSSSGGKARKGAKFTEEHKAQLSKSMRSTTEELDNTIREEYETGNYSQADLCRKYNLSHNVVWRIVHKK